MGSLSRAAWFHSDAPSGRHVNSGSLGFKSSALRGRRVHSRSREFTMARLRGFVLGFA